MWRSFMSRSQPLLSHHRRPTGCSYGNTAAAAALGGADRRILRRRAYASDTALGPEVGGEIKSWPRPRRHLYVVLDEMNTGHSVYRLNVDDLDGGDEDAVTARDRRVPHQTMSLPYRLPEPVLRLGYQSLGGTCAHFEALGSKIVATGASHGNGWITFVYDTKTARLDIGQRPPEDLPLRRYRAADVGNKLYTFSGHGRASQYLCEQWALSDDEDDGYDSGQDGMVFMMRGQIKEWAWKKSPWQMPCAADRYFVNSYAVHPDGRTLVVSCSYSTGYKEPHRRFTFFIDTEDGKSLRTGEWRLPFDGRGYYDNDLDAWVGIRQADGTDDGAIRGHPYLCSCDVPDLAGDQALSQAPSWKMCKAELTFLESPLNSGSRALVHTGRGRFCLVEVAAAPLAEGEEARRHRTRHSGLACLLHVTMLRAKHGKNGELLVAPCRPGRSFLVPNYSSGSPTAFWM